MFGIRMIKWKNLKSVFTIQNTELEEMVKTKQRTKKKKKNSTCTFFYVKVLSIEFNRIVVYILYTEYSLYGSYFENTNLLIHS